MGDSWRNILERAATNLAVDLDPAAPLRQPEPHLSSSLSRPAVQSYRSFEESRAALERELAALSASIPTAYVQPTQAQRVEAGPTGESGAVRTAPITRPIAVKPPQAESRRAKRSRAWRNVAAVSISSAVVVASGYVLVGYFKAGEIALPQMPRVEKAFNIDVRPEIAVAQPATIQASVEVPDVEAAPELNQGTEDVLMERGLSQLAQGDGAAGRAVLEVLARYGSVRGALALAETYDPANVRHRPEWGLAADVERAREWYRKAADLGSVNAYQRLKELDRTNQSSMARQSHAA
ncbi:hypothetical protein T281_15475 [Rhodomicrobium udaipurense JA643]|uniref:Sel1 repeat family protein n=1 Tax=Rhodomicrobium udaipurense TaxID=1202716 RepID=A0A8I1GIL9_9HYPH|nr:hypothetical protein [Rhodomicrobium udaipurense]KAI93637.1 hypothetical protein T281_15475 [Rhodomicrobium udaipurense JA643]MBJ7545026.1 hypothetical protein [Rhodomicrobium udaipurense]